MSCTQRLLRWLVATVVLCCTIAGHPDENDSAGLYLAKLRVENSDLSATLNLEQAIRIVVTALDKDALAAQLAATTVELIENRDTGLVLEITPDNHFRSLANAGHEKSTWVIDYEEPVITAISKEWSQEQAATTIASLGALTDFAARQIHTPDSRSGFAIASQVARNRSGDCSEYAVLQTALARADGRAARVVLGIVVIMLEDRVEAWGHAWSEIQDNNRWVVADATLPRAQEGVRGVYYMPAMLLTNEGPGHALDVLNFANLRPNMVRLLPQPAEQVVP